jgi:hypothetical protein
MRYVVSLKGLQCGIGLQGFILIPFFFGLLVIVGRKIMKRYAHCISLLIRRRLVL